jgi:hypothetical protein
VSISGFDPKRISMMFSSGVESKEATSSPLKLQSTGSSKASGEIIKTSISELKKKARRAGRLLRLSYCLSILVLLASILVFNVISFNLSTDLTQNTNQLDGLGIMRYWAANLAFLTKKLNLIGTGVISSEEEASIRAEIQTGIDAVAAAVNDFKAELELTADKTIEGKDRLAWWESKVDSTYTVRQGNLYSIMERSLIDVMQILGTESAQVNADMPAYTNIQMNLPLTTLRYLNQTVVELVDTFQSSTDSVGNLYDMILVAALIVFVLLSSALFIPAFLSITAASRQIWSVFEAVPVEALLVHRERVQSRLIEVHGDDLSSAEGLVRQKERQFKATVYPHLKYLIASTGFLWLAIGGFVYLMVDFGSLNFFQPLRHKTEFLHYSGLRRGCFADSLFFMAEVAYPGAHWDQHALKTNPLHAFSDAAECSRVAVDFCFYNHPFEYSDFTDFMFNDARLISSNPILGRGLQGSLKELMFMQHDSAALLADGSNWADVVREYLPAHSAVMAEISSSLDIYKRESRTAIQASGSLMVQISVLFSVALVCAYTFIIELIITKTTHLLKVEAKLLGLLKGVSSLEINRRVAKLIES